MDEFRKEQKKQCNDGSSNKRGKYGCPCCRKYPNLNKHKKKTRVTARHRLSDKDRKTFQEEISSDYA